jgi:hypothetical protein
MCENPFLYIAVSKFDPEDKDRWDSYVEWSGLTQIHELISFDPMLCSNVVDDLVDEDWDYNVHEDYRTFFFKDASYLLHRIGDAERVNILALLEEPSPVDERPEIRVQRI